jgi:hypothetical protein
MRINVIFREENEKIKLTNKPLSEYMNVSFSDIQYIPQDDYNKLENKPMINSVVLEGAITAEELGLARVYYDTKAAWDRQTTLIAERSVVYIYSDYKILEDEAGNQTEIAGIKIGDGSSYLIDMPFITDAATYMIVTHIADKTMHVTAAEREFWNNKVSAFINPQSGGEELILSKTQYELNGVIVDCQ